MVGQVRLGMVGLRTHKLAGSMPYLIFDYNFQMEDFSSLWHCLKGGEKPAISVRQ